MRISLYILRVLEYNLNEGFCLPCSAGTYKQKSRQDAGTGLDFPVSPCPYPAGSASLKRAIFVRNCRTHGKMRAGWSGVLGYYTIIGFPIRRVYTKTLRIY